MEVNSIENIVIIRHEVCGGEERVAGGEAVRLDILAAGARIRPSSSHGRDDP
jgi:hypothetical protein